MRELVDRKWWLLLLLFFACTWLLFASTHWLNNNNFSIIYPLRLLVIFICVLLAAFRLRKVIISGDTERKKNTMVAVSFSLILLLTMEAGFMFIPLIRSAVVSHSSRIWLGYYWKPINRYGFRDQEIDHKEISKKKKIFIVGDSFVAGQGIKHVKDRFSDRLRDKICQDYCVLNMGVSGYNSFQEFNSLSQFPETPDVLILSYLGNDIEGLVPLKDEIFRPYLNLSPIARFLIRGSFLLDFIYWQLPHGSMADYIDVMIGGYQNDQIRNDHFEELMQFVRYAQENNVQMIGLIFPFIGDYVRSEEYIKPVSDFFTENQVDIINVTGIIRDYPAKELMVSRFDIHPSVFMNDLLADTLHRYLSARKYIVCD